MNDTNVTSRTSLRITSGIVAVIFTIITLLLSYLQITKGPNLVGLMMLTVPTTIAIIFWWVTARVHISESRRLMGSALKYGVIVGFLSFLLGIIGPLILGYVSGLSADQGPLLGIFITGPLGAILGAIGGYLYARSHHQN
ncbi:MAG: hypothetical protein WC817_00005 [Patescibacteria group bacterium]|jgi:hypothetical protein